MCIGLWSLDHPNYALYASQPSRPIQQPLTSFPSIYRILGTNRDEDLSRPTVNANFHNFGREGSPDDGFVLSGRDLQAGGSWFGINRAGRVALLSVTYHIHMNKIKRRLTLRC